MGRLVKRKILLSFLLVFLLICLPTFTGCGSEDKGTADTVTVRFVQDGYEDILLVADRGGALERVPAPKEKVGYDVKWERADFSVVESDLVINAVYSAKSYVITFTAGSQSGNAELIMWAERLTVKYDEALSLPTPPVCRGYDFVCWQYGGEEFSPSVYNIADNITLVARWKLSGGLDTGNY